MKQSLQSRSRAKRPPPGTSPGAISIPEQALEPVIKVLQYNEALVEEKELKDPKEIHRLVDSNPQQTFWIDIRGFGDRTFFEQLSDVFGIHRLQMEDVLNIYQRPKIEEFTDYVFMISRVLRKKEESLQNDQLSLFLGKNFVITIQDKYEDVFDPVRERIRSGRGIIRKSGAGYLSYAVMDAALDNFFPLLQETGDRLDELEEELIDNPSRLAMNAILKIKRDLIEMRRTIWAERDKVNDILRSHIPLISEANKVYFHDSYDHCVQVLDIVGSYKEVTSSMMDVYMSSVSNRLNQVMKVLTIISTIFIPLTFIVGVYGMNFARINPDTGEHLPLNMPELYSPLGYVIVWIVMAFIVIIQLIFYYRKGWLTG